MIKPETLALFKTPPFKHQLVGVEALLKNKAFAIFDEMGAGKSKQVVDAACCLAKADKIDTIVVLAPASVRCVWLDKEIGEIRRHSWASNVVYEFHKKTAIKWKDDSPKSDTPVIAWIVTNYEFLRRAAHLEDLLQMLKGRKTLLVCDESAYVKNRTATQTKAVMRLRNWCARCVILNGTPVTNSPLDLWSQMNILSPEILQNNFHNFYHFRSEYCEMVARVMGNFRFQKVVRYRRLDELARRVSPYVLRREKKDCLDLPPKLFTEREVRLSEESWERYKVLRDEALVELRNSEKQIEPNVGVRLLRLSQLTSGQLGGVTPCEGEIVEIHTTDFSAEKLDWAFNYLTEESTAQAVIVWCRWRRERERLAVLLRKDKKILCFELYGGQKKEERERAVAEFSKITPSEMRIVLLAQPHAGGHGLNLIRATEAIYLSNDYALGMRLQSEDRCHRPGQRNAVTYIDVLATGPEGQRTIDHIIFKALREKRNVASLTTSEWRKGLEDE